MLEALDRIKEGIIITDNREIILAANRAVSLISGYNISEILGQTPRIFSSGMQEPGFYKNMWDKLYHEGYWQGEVMNRSKSGNIYPEWLSINALKDENGHITNYVGVFMDISERKEWEQTLQFQAFHDALTQLPNRRLLDQHLPQVIATAKRQQTILAIGILDLDDFKPVNDTYGHEAGDQLLYEFGERLLSSIREEDFLARLGGDEFVLVFKSIEPTHYKQDLIHIFNRLHHVVEKPFTVADNQQVEVGMSMGVAIFPMDEEDGDALLRLADARLFRTKSKKTVRNEWWEWDSMLEEQDAVSIEVAFDPYGEEAKELLNRSQTWFMNKDEMLATKFYENIMKDHAFSQIISSWPEEEHAIFLNNIKQHMVKVFHPSATLDQIQSEAKMLGQRFILMGLDNLMLVKMATWFRQWFVERLNEISMRAKARYRFSLLANLRVQDDLMAMLQMEEDIMTQYQQVLLSELKNFATWRSMVEEELMALGRLPGVMGALLFRLDQKEAFTVEFSAGAKATEISTIFRNPTSQLVLNSNSPRGNAAVAKVWRHKQIEHISCIMTNPESQFWKEDAARIGICSLIALPVMDERNEPVAVIVLYGEYVNQFESIQILQFANHLQHRWSRLWWMTKQLVPKQALSQDLSDEYRTRLFTGGLQMYVQPLIDLTTGKIAKVEGLARLQLSNGELLPPSAFLPLLNEEELHLLFRQGLDQALAGLKSWEESGTFIELSINVSPSTLLHSEFPDWIQEKLYRYQVKPSRLSLEVLENEPYDEEAFFTAIQPLIRLGVSLSIDDLGSGYSSLERLSNRFFQLIKIDKVLLFRIHQDPQFILSMIDLLIQFGENLGLDVVVEGLESPDLLEAVMVLNAKFGQGFGISRPIPIHQLPMWINTFQLPVKNGEIHTYLGALAYHWKAMKNPSKMINTSWRECPLTLFLEEKGLLGSQQALWHQQIHNGQNVQQLSQKLTDWLIEQWHAEESSNVFSK